MNQVIRTHSSPSSVNFSIGSFHSIKKNNNQNNYKSNNNFKCTCEIRKLKSTGKFNRKYSMCDACSEKLFSTGDLSHSN